MCGTSRTFYLQNLYLQVLFKYHTILYCRDNKTITGIYRVGFCFFVYVIFNIYLTFSCMTKISFFFGKYKREKFFVLLYCYCINLNFLLIYDSVKLNAVFHWKLYHLNGTYYMKPWNMNTYRAIFYV